MCDIHQIAVQFTNSVRFDDTYNLITWRFRSLSIQHDFISSVLRFFQWLHYLFTLNWVFCRNNSKTKASIMKFSSQFSATTIFITVWWEIEWCWNEDDVNRVCLCDFFLQTKALWLFASFFLKGYANFISLVRDSFFLLRFRFLSVSRTIVQIILKW